MNEKNRVKAKQKVKFLSTKLRSFYKESGILVVRPDAKMSGKGLAATFKYLGSGGNHNHVTLIFCYFVVY